MLVGSLKRSIVSKKVVPGPGARSEGRRRSCLLLWSNTTVWFQAPNTCAGILSCLLKEWTWELQHSEAVNLSTKRKAFDMVMAVRRLEEEQKILLTEMIHQWKCLSTRADNLTDRSCTVSSEPMKGFIMFYTQDSQSGLSEEGLNGLWSIIQKKLCNIREVMQHARKCYLQVFS